MADSESHLSLGGRAADDEHLHAADDAATAGKSMRRPPKRKLPAAAEGTQPTTTTTTTATPTQANTGDASVQIRSSAIYSPPRGWAELTNDLLKATSTFLTLGGVTTRMMPVCRDWMRAAIEAPRRDCVVKLSSAQLTAALQSPFRRHISDLEVPTEWNWREQEWSEPPLSNETLALMKQQLPGLISLKCTIDCTTWEGKAAQPLAFPSTLHTLRVALPTVHDPSIDESMLDTASFHWWRVQVALEDIVQVPQLTTLELHCHKRIGCSDVPTDTLEPLTRLRGSLTSLRIEQHHPTGRKDEIVWSRERMKIFRSLDRLTSLQISDDEWTAQDLEWLAADPVPVSLQKLDLKCTIIDQPTAMALGRLTSLTSFEPNKVNLTNVFFLTQLPRLEAVHLNFESGCRIDLDLLMSALAHRPLLTKFSLFHPGIADAHLSTLLPSLPRLKELRLESFTSLVGLSWITSVAHFATLEVLALSSRASRRTRPSRGALQSARATL